MAWLVFVGKRSSKRRRNAETHRSANPTDPASHRLAIQLDENEALKAALQSTLRAKEEDLRLYSDMMSQVKHVFLQALRQHKQEAGPAS